MLLDVQTWLAGFLREEKGKKFFSPKIENKGIKHLIFNKKKMMAKLPHLSCFLSKFSVIFLGTSISVKEQMDATVSAETTTPTKVVTVIVHVPITVIVVTTMLNCALVAVPLTVTRVLYFLRKPI